MPRGNKPPVTTEDLLALDERLRTQKIRHHTGRGVGNEDLTLAELQSEMQQLEKESTVLLEALETLKNDINDAMAVTAPKDVHKKIELGALVAAEQIKKRLEQALRSIEILRITKAKDANPNNQAQVDKLYSDIEAFENNSKASFKLAIKDLNKLLVDKEAVSLNNQIKWVDHLVILLSPPNQTYMIYLINELEKITKDIDKLPEKQPVFDQSKKMAYMKKKINILIEEKIIKKISALPESNEIKNLINRTFPDLVPPAWNLPKVAVVATSAAEATTQQPSKPPRRSTAELAELAAQQQAQRPPKRNAADLLLAYQNATKPSTESPSDSTPSEDASLSATKNKKK
jgi:hypothetical protein